MSNDPIPLEVGDEFLVRDCRLVSPLSYHRQILQVLQELLIVGNREHNGSSLAMIVGQILKRVAHGQTVSQNMVASRFEALSSVTRKKTRPKAATLLLSS